MGSSPLLYVLAPFRQAMAGARTPPLGAPISITPHLVLLAARLRLRFTAARRPWLRPSACKPGARENQNRQQCGAEQFHLMFHALHPIRLASLHITCGRRGLIP
jgi:hypothetical protein